jgi:hypothetical protein
MTTRLACDEPALRFWLRYAEREGALVEGQRDHALVLLPEALREQSGLPEEVAVTDHPDVAREDGAALVIAGHPAVERATTAVLAEGDAGSRHLLWPTARAPARAQLEARAREHVQVEHGRIDAAGEPAAAYLPLLRVGAVLSCTASLTLRVQEQQEVWVDARTRLEASERLRAAVADRAGLERADRPARHLPADLDRAVAAAQGLLEARAAARERSLSAHAGRALAAELARTDAYYEAALDSLTRRRATAQPDRARLLDDQALATRAEHARRRLEIETAHEPRHELRPFRLHLVHVPAYVLPVEVRRGSRRFPFELCWVPAGGEFASHRCPACGAAEELIAGRESLGCRACTPGAARNVAPALQIVPAPTPTPASVSRHAPMPPPAPMPTPRRPKGSVARHARPAFARGPARTAKPADTQRTGNRLALAFWQCVASGERWPRQKAARDSPLRAVYRLYGAAGPGYAIGLPVGARPDSVEAGTCLSVPGLPELTSGFVSAGGAHFDYTLRWSLQAGKPVIAEVMPAEDPLELPPARIFAGGLDDRLRGGAPVPAVTLDPVAQALWDVEAERHGLPLTIRCLAGWWRVQAEFADDGARPAAIAAALAHAEARAAGARESRAQTARAYAVDVEELPRGRYP